VYEAPEQAWWQGRVDPEEGATARYWHQVVSLDPPVKPGVALLGLASDRGVQINRGRPGAVEGPAALRNALAGLAWHHDTPLIDAGNIRVGDDLPAGQEAYAERLLNLLDQRQFVIGLGGGHEIGWASYLGCRRYLDRIAPGKTLGIVNIDAHFDLRTTAPAASSGTPFYQVAQHCKEQGHPFRYACLGIARSANTRALFERADSLGVEYLMDIDFSAPAAQDLLQRFLAQVDSLYVTCCLDAFPASAAPGVSAPAALGISPAEVLRVIEALGEQCRAAGVHWLMADIAELSPAHDLDNRTARLAARVVDELLAAHSRRL
jgi:formiminoglutamase